MWKDKNWVKPIGSAMGIFLCAFMVFSFNEEQEATAVAEVNKPVSDLSYFTIRDNLKSMTEARFNDYARSIEGTRVKWTGYVENVDEGLLGGYTVWVDMDTNDSLLSVQEVYFDISADKATELRKGSKITVEGNIASVIGMLETTAQVDLEAVRYWGGS